MAASTKVEELVAKAIEAWKAEYTMKINTLQIKLANVETSQSFISTKYVHLKANYDNLLKMKKKQKEEINNLKSNLSNLEEKRQKNLRKLIR